MAMALVIRQLSSVLDRLLIREAAQFRLTPQDALVLGWLVHTPGLGAAEMAYRLGRKRQNVQRTLERLEDRFLVERHEDRDRTTGWGLTEYGRTTWEQLEARFLLQDMKLHGRGIDLKHWCRCLDELMEELIGATRDSWVPQLVVPPQPEAEPDDLDH